MITKLKYGNTNTFLLKGSQGSILVDTDYAGTLSLFYKAIKEKQIQIKDITYLLATHYHPDHIGLISELMQQGIPLLIMESQKNFINFSDEIFSRQPSLHYISIDKSTAKVLCFDESRSFLHGLGLNGEIVSTPSHSEDSISIILDEGIAIVGDLEPLDYLEGYNDNPKLKKDWETVMSFHPKTVYYAHANEQVVRGRQHGTVS